MWKQDQCCHVTPIPRLWPWHLHQLFQNRTPPLVAPYLPIFAFLLTLLVSRLPGIYKPLIWSIRQLLLFFHYMSSLKV